MTKKIVEFKTKQAKDILKKIKICIATKQFSLNGCKHGISISKIFSDQDVFDTIAIKFHDSTENLITLKTILECLKRLSDSYIEIVTKTNVGYNTILKMYEEGIVTSSSPNINQMIDIVNELRNSSNIVAFKYEKEEFEQLAYDLNLEAELDTFKKQILNGNKVDSSVIDLSKDSITHKYPNLPVFKTIGTTPEDFKSNEYLKENGLKPNGEAVGIFKNGGVEYLLYNARDSKIFDKQKYFNIDSDCINEDGLPVFKGWLSIPECLKSNKYFDRHGLKHDDIVSGIVRCGTKEYKLFRKDTATIVDEAIYLNPLEKKSRSSKIKSAAKKEKLSKNLTTTSINATKYKFIKEGSVKKNAAYWKALESDWVINSDKYVILDTETTGVSKEDQVIQLSIINLNGKILFHSYFYTSQKMNPFAWKVNKISKNTINKAPKWEEHWDEIKEILKSKIILAHNNKFDLRLIEQTCERNNTEIDFKVESVCTLEYSRYKYYPTKLSKAANLLGVDTESMNLHNALVDCNLCLHIINPKNPLFNKRKKAQKYFESICELKIRNGDIHGKTKGLQWIKKTFNLDTVDFDFIDLETCDSIISVLEPTVFKYKSII